MGAMEEKLRLDRVYLFQNQVSFLIPHEWVEGHANGNFYFYHAPEADSGWLRVSLITPRMTQESAANEIQQLENDWVNDPKVFVFREENTGNLLKKWEKSDTEDGTDIHLYYWSVANTVKPDKVLVALFSLTILADRIDAPETRYLVSLMEGLISLTQISETYRIQ
jgi:hypothetical protein